MRGAFCFHNNVGQCNTMASLCLILWCLLLNVSVVPGIHSQVKSFFFSTGSENGSVGSNIFLVLNVVLVVIVVAICVPATYPHLFFVLIGQVISWSSTFESILLGQKEKEMHCPGLFKSSGQLLVISHRVQWKRLWLFFFSEQAL